MKILILFLFSVLFVNFNTVKAIQRSVFCTSSNDPHMRGFNGNTFEHQYNGTFCLYNSRKVKISAEFRKCPDPFPLATCNCRIRIDIIGTGQFAEVNTCDGGLLTDTDRLKIDSVPNTFPPPGSGDVPFNNFVYGAAADVLYIRTNFNSAHDIMVELYDTWNNFWNIRIFPSDSYVSTRYALKDCCLCALNKLLTTDVPKACTAFVYGSCASVYTALLDTQGVADLKELEKNCNIDSTLSFNESKCTNLGIFQEASIDRIIFQSLARVKKTDNNFGLVFDVNWMDWAIIEKICACREMKPNRALAEGIFTHPIQLCV